MSSLADAYFDQLPEDRKAAMNQLRETIKKNLPKGFVESFDYKMPGFSVPHSLYPEGFHCDPKIPLPFVSVASQKNFIALYHMGMYANPSLLKWFEDEYPKHSKTKLDMGKSCIRFKKPETIPFDLIAELMTKMTPEDWIPLYEKELKK
jgi:uncharacterized protein YdhG (YjbR/CyaY superfamily)